MDLRALITSSPLHIVTRVMMFVGKWGSLLRAQNCQDSSRTHKPPKPKPFKPRSTLLLRRNYIIHNRSMYGP